MNLSSKKMYSLISKELMPKCIDSFYFEDKEKLSLFQDHEDIRFHKRFSYPLRKNNFKPKSTMVEYLLRSVMITEITNKE